MKIRTAILIVTTLVFVSSSSIKAQCPSFEPGATVVNIGIGAGGPYYYRGGYYHRSYSMPNVSISADYGLQTKAGPGTLALGGIIGVRGFRYKEIIYPGSYPIVVYHERRWTDIYIAGRLTYHLGFEGNDKFDFYPGVSLGAVIGTFTEITPLIDRYPTPPYDWYKTGEIRAGDSWAAPALGIFVGLRYNFTEKIGAFTELGWEFTAFKLGVAIKL